MISDKAKEQAVEVIIKGIKDWESVKAARAKSAWAANAYLPSVTVGQHAEAILDDVIALIEGSK